MEKVQVTFNQSQVIVAYKLIHYFQSFLVSPTTSFKQNKSLNLSECWKLDLLQWEKLCLIWHLSILWKIQCITFRDYSLAIFLTGSLRILISSVNLNRTGHLLHDFQIQRQYFYSHQKTNLKSMYFGNFRKCLKPNQLNIFVGWNIFSTRKIDDKASPIGYKKDHSHMEITSCKSLQETNSILH